MLSWWADPFVHYRSVKAAWSLHFFLCFMAMMIWWYNNCVALYNFNQLWNFPHCDAQSFDVSTGVGGDETAPGCGMLTCSPDTFFIVYFNKQFWIISWHKSLYADSDSSPNPVNNSMKKKMLTEVVNQGYTAALVYCIWFWLQVRENEASERQKLILAA